MHDSRVLSINHVSPEEELAVLSHLIHLLQDAVASGALVSFLPLPAQRMCSSRAVLEDGLSGSRPGHLRASRTRVSQIIGSVQLALATKPNAKHQIRRVSNHHD